jgi:hypothetical protein
MSGIYPRSPVVKANGIRWNTSDTDFPQIKSEIHSYGTPRFPKEKQQSTTILVWMTPEQVKQKQIAMFNQRRGHVGAAIFERKNQGAERETVQKIKESMIRGDKFTPLSFFHDRYGVIEDVQEGAHRTHALLELGVKKVPVWLRFAKGDVEGKEMKHYPKTEFEIHKHGKQYEIGERPEDVGDFGRRWRRANRDHISRFNKHLSTNKEWFVITDKNMNVLSAHEGGKHRVSGRVREKAYSDARSKLPEGEQEVYAFHSHPKHYGIAAQSPSRQDLKRLVYPIAYEAHNHDLNIRAEGVMTRHGTNVIGIEDPTFAQGPRMRRYYSKQELIRQREEAEARGITKDNYKTKDPREMIRLLHSGRDKAFSDTQERYPELQTEFVKRDIIRPSDVRPHTVINRSMHQYQYKKPEMNEEQINEIKKLFEQPSPEPVGEFGKRKKKKSKARRIFYGI